jgi:hypothetical protein
MTSSPSEPTRQGTGYTSARAALLGSGSGGPPRGRSRIPTRALVGIVAALMLLGSAAHLSSAIKAGRHEGTRGTWVATGKECSHVGGCVWRGKFVLPGGHVELTNASYIGAIPHVIHVGTAVAGLYPGGSALVFPLSGSTLWVSMLIGAIVGALGLVWACYRPARNYLEHRRNAVIVTSTVPRG